LLDAERRAQTLRGGRVLRRAAQLAERVEQLLELA